MITVQRMQLVLAGTVIGQSGGGSSDYGPHLEFQIRQENAGNPIALDPENWLKRRRRD
jgi:murein DD-endopeptidase MepM/ murein hydrolase activator NlpD